MRSALMTTLVYDESPPTRPVQSYADLWQHAVALVIECARMGVTRVVTGPAAPTAASGSSPGPAATLQVVVAGHEPEHPDPDLVTISKAILTGPEYRAIARLDQRIKKQVRTLGLPISAFFKHALVVPVTFLDAVEDLLEAYLRDRAQAVQAFIAAYPVLIQRAAVRLGALYDPADYPSVEAIRGLFQVSIRYLTFDMPGVLAAFSERARQRALADGQGRLAEAVEEMHGYLRETMAALVSRLREKLAPDPVTGEAKVLRAASLTKLLDFLDTFASRNVVAQDGELADLVEQARQVLAGTELSALRKDADLRAVLKAGLDNVATQLDALLVKKGARQYVWEDEGGEAAA